MPIDKAAQEAEAAANRAAGINPADRAAALDTGGDGVPQDPGTRAAPSDPPQQQQPLPPARTAFDNKRDAIHARFRTERNAADAEAADDITAFARDGGMPQDFRQAAGEPEPAADVVDDVVADQGNESGDPLPQPRTVKLKVHGKEIEMPLEEALAKAQIAMAADNVLDEAKTRLKQVDELLAQTRDRATHAAQPNTTANGVQSEAFQAEQQTDPNQGNERKLAEVLQFGDPEEAETLLQNTIEQRAQQIVQRQLYEQRLAEEGSRTAKVLKDFEESNKEIAADPKARAVIEQTMLDLQREDLVALGLDPNRIRQDGQPPTPGDIAIAHRHYRATGYGVRPPQDILQAATDAYKSWKGIKDPTPADPAQKGAPRIDVSVDRTARRQAIPQQPSRTSAPRTEQAPAEPPRDRSSIVLAEKARRAKMRGQVGIGT
jgi:hypothetical protein